MDITILLVTQSNIEKMVTSKGSVKPEDFLWLGLMVSDSECIITSKCKRSIPGKILSQMPKPKMANRYGSSLRPRTRPCDGHENLGKSGNQGQMGAIRKRRASHGCGPGWTRGRVCRQSVGYSRQTGFENCGPVS